MNDDEKTRRVGTGNTTFADAQKTRLVRNDTSRYTPDTNMPATPAPNKDDGKTKLAFRPSKDPAKIAELAASNVDSDRHVTGFVVIVNGPGRGNFSALYDGKSSIGRGDDQAAILDFGDESISREGHAYITYDYMERKFYLQSGNTTNVVRVNNKLVLQPIELNNDDLILIGQTTLSFIAFCGEKFDWQEK